MIRIFLSSEGKQRKFCHQLVGKIEERRFNVWSGFNPEAEVLRGYWSRVEYQIQHADVILGVIASIYDTHVVSEIKKAARSTRIILIFPEHASNELREFGHSVSAEVIDLHDWNTGADNTQFERLIAILEEEDRNAAIRSAVDVRRADTSAFLESVLEISREKHEHLLANKPNEDEALANWTVSEGRVLSIISHLERVSENIPEEGKSIPLRKVRNISKVIADLRALSSDWYKDNAADVMDSTIRASLIGLIVGVGAIFGQPVIGAGVGLTMFGGKKLVDGVSSALQIGAKSSG